MTLGLDSSAKCPPPGALQVDFSARRAFGVARSIERAAFSAGNASLQAYIAAFCPFRCDFSRVRASRSRQSVAVCVETAVRSTLNAARSTLPAPFSRRRGPRRGENEANCARKGGRRLESAGPSTSFSAFSTHHVSFSSRRSVLQAHSDSSQARAEKAQAHEPEVRGGAPPRDAAAPRARVDPRARAHGDVARRSAREPRNGRCSGLTTACTTGPSPSLPRPS
jgi:hypothetical protein